uniref:Uncharacterized protein n=1 Tax=Oryza brachyantha TaxID=4533 RepID=J3NA19_ORYBR
MPVGHDYHNFIKVKDFNGSIRKDFGSWVSMLRCKKFKPMPIPIGSGTFRFREPCWAKLSSLQINGGIFLLSLMTFFYLLKMAYYIPYS